MGTDIHAFIEIKINDNWVVYSKPLIQRNYRVFSYIANVENHYGIVPITTGREMPKDASELVKLSYEYDLERLRIYGLTWLTVSEINRLLATQPWEFTYYQFGYLYGNGIGDFDPEFDYPKFIQDVRMICWFDN